MSVSIREGARLQTHPDDKLPLTSLICFALTYYLFQYQEDLSALVKAAIVALAGITTGLLFYPFSELSGFMLTTSCTRLPKKSMASR